MKRFDKSDIALGILVAVVAVFLIFIIVFYTSGGNGHNAVGTSTDCVEWFTDTGIDVKNAQNRVYNIVKDPNGFLYYSSDVEGALSPVLNEFGLPTKDVELFQ